MELCYEDVFLFDSRTANYVSIEDLEGRGGKMLWEIKPLELSGETFRIDIGDNLRSPKNAFDVDMTEADANQFYDEFFREYQGLAAWHAQAKRDANDEKVIEVRTLGVDRRQYIGDQWWNRFTALLNTRFRALALRRRNSLWWRSTVYSKGEPS